MTFETVGTVTLTPDDAEIVIGSFSMEESDTTLWVRVTQTNPPGPWPWSYGILSWRTSFGNELGSIKCYGEPAGEVFRLGVGLSPLERTGQLIFEPRSYNLAWTRNGYPWTLEFEAQSGSTVGVGPPVFGTRATLGVLADFADSVVSYSIKNGIASIVLR